ncbi:MAG: hypothetical protein HUU20_16075, partial [Pirellulales bacterium]|nr:hypothetical protein [Pirellulales bacterium]
GRPISAPWQPQLPTGLSALAGPRPASAAGAGETLRSLRPATSTEIPIAWSLASGEDPFRRYTGLKEKQLSAALAGESDIPDIGPWVGPGRSPGERPLGTFEAIRRRDPELADSIQKRTERRLSGLTGLPMDVRQQMVTARAQGMPIDSGTAVVRSREPVLAALMGRSPEAAVSYDAMRRLSDPAVVSRQAKTRALLGMLETLPRAENPEAVVRAARELVQQLLGGEL